MAYRQESIFRHLFIWLAQIIEDNRDAVTFRHAGKHGQGCSQLKAGARDDQMLSTGAPDNLADTGVLPDSNDPQEQEPEELD